MPRPDPREAEASNGVLAYRFLKSMVFLGRLSVSRAPNPVPPVSMTPILSLIFKLEHHCLVQRWAPRQSHRHLLAAATRASLLVGTGMRSSLARYGYTHEELISVPNHCTQCTSKFYRANFMASCCSDKPSHMLHLYMPQLTPDLYPHQLWHSDFPTPAFGLVYIPKYIPSTVRIHVEGRIP